MECAELETVQYKFASIIGGLCGKPKILSQFAVWLDMRLAEYKLKGAISLDCSGIKPDPDWLDGIKQDNEPVKRVQETCPRNMSPLDRVDNHYSRHPGIASNTVVDADVVIKTEYPESNEQSNAGDVYPVSIHPHSAEDFPPLGASRRNRTNESYKRKAREIRHHPKAKIAAFSAATNDSADLQEFDIVPVNESLVSLIKASTHDASDLPVCDRASVSQSFDGLPVQGSPQSHLATSAPTSVAGRNLDPQEELGAGSYLTSSRGPGDDSSYLSPQQLQQAIQDQEVLSLLNSNQSRRSRIKNREQKPANTVRNVVAAVGHFERWLWGRSQGAPRLETRQIFELPPQELDRCLVDFFTEAEKPNGDNFHPDSFRSLRSRLESYLKDNDYPESLIHSAIFSDSRIAFQRRFLELTDIYNNVKQSRRVLENT